jgi:hypothetical protein
MLATQVLYISSPFCSGYLGDGFSQTICPGWPRTEILLLSASQVARITGVSCRHPPHTSFIEEDKKSRRGAQEHAQQVSGTTGRNTLKTPFRANHAEARNAHRIGVGPPMLTARTRVYLH